MADQTRTFTFMGTGTSVGVPMVGCDCDVCTSNDPRNHRYRSGVLLRLPKGNVIIDTSPELRLQLLREKVRLVHSVIYTHYHADHLFGLDDLRPVAKYLGRPVPLYCTAEVERKVRQSFAYAFQGSNVTTASTYLPNLAFHRIDESPFEVLGQTFVPIPLVHAHFEVYGYRFDDVAFCTDVNKIPEESWPRLEGLRILVLDALRERPHPAHFNLEQALEVVERIRPERAYFTHISHEIDHVRISKKLPPNVQLAYDGLQFEF
ncbi:MAG: MBL fold metallo-hydrolase [Gemmataceae bacterium]